MKKPLLIGEAPSKNEATPRPLEGRVGRRLAECCGISLDEFLHRFERVNLLTVRQDTKEKGFEFDAVTAAQVAHTMATPGCPDFAFHEGRIVLLLGKRVATAFGAHGDYFELQHVGTKANVYVLPHPSGVNRWWNDPENKQRACEFMRSLLWDPVTKHCIGAHEFDSNGDCKNCPKVIMTVHPETATGR